MSFLTSIGKRITNFGYDGAKSTKRRKIVSVAGGAEERVLPLSDRKALSDRSRDARRNFSIAAWAIRKHLDYVSRFTFQAKTGDKALDTELETLLVSWSMKGRFEEAGRHRLAKMVRIAEASRTVDGDVGWLLLRNGKVQGIEGDRIRNPTGEVATRAIGDKKTKWEMGVKLNKAGRHLAYSIHERVNRGGTFKFERTVKASSFLFHGYFDRYDQCRGVSPVAASLNNYRDAYENFDYALAKAKVGQLFTLAMYSSSIEPGDELNIDFDNQGPIIAELNDDEKLELLESKTPSGEFVDFHQVIISVAMKSLDLPYSFYDESYTNFFGSKAALQHYLRSCKFKIEDLQELLNQWLIFRLRVAIIDGEFLMPAGMTLFDLLRKVDWVPDGVPWWDPAKEVRGDVEMIKAGLSNPQRICRERGQGDYYENIDKTAEAVEYARAKGLVLSFDPDAEKTAEPVVDGSIDPETGEPFTPAKKEESKIQDGETIDNEN